MPPLGGFLKCRIFLENRFFTLQTLFLPSGARKSVFRKKCFFDPDANGHTHTQTIFFHMTLLTVEGTKKRIYLIE